jgi:hypothetical protein
MKHVLILMVVFGQVRFGQVPVPGASVQVTQGDKTFKTITNADGSYSFPDLAEGTWTFEIQAPGFETVRKEAAVTPGMQWDLNMLSIADVKAATSPGFPAAPPAPTLQVVSEGQAEAADRLLINGSVSNGASTPFALRAAFGNSRRSVRSLYTGTMSVSVDNSLLDARSLSLTGQDTPKPAYNRLQNSITFGGPFQIPTVFRNGMFILGYSRTQNRNASVQTAEMPTPEQRLLVSDDQISPQAKALLNLYPQPNFNGSGRYNYQVAVVGVTHSDNFQGAVNNFTIGTRDRVSGGVTYQSSRTDNPNLFLFTDNGRTTTATSTISWSHRFSQRITGVTRYQFNRTVSQTLPYFGTRVDVSGDAGISGNDRDPRNWGPPSLIFASGIATLSSGSFAFDRSQLSAISFSSNWNRTRHSIAFGVDHKKQQFNLLSQQKARGTFTFTGAATGNDFTDFLLGIPTASSLALGNADKYYRQGFSDAFVTDDWRLKPALTLNLGVRWEYESPITELYGRLVNLDIAPHFISATPVIAETAHNSLLHPDRSGFEPRISLAWRPRVSGSLVVRAAYGMYRDTSVYRSIADQMAQQSPLSKSLSVQNTPANPLSLANGFNGSPSVTATTFAVDPHFRVGSAQNWQLSLQHDLPSSMQFTMTYLGIKGTHVPQRVLPNTFPVGVLDSCGSCPTGFVYLSSNGNSSRQTGTVELRRRQRNGFEGSVRYTFSKAIDNAGIGTSHIAQNWLDLHAERGLSDFDERHQIALQTQYTTAMLAGIGSFWDSWLGRPLRQWTLSAQLTAGSGSPLTPLILAPVNGTGITGSLRPNVTGAPLFIGGFLNPAAFILPGPGLWGNAPRNSITGPEQFALNASLAHTFRVNDRLSMDLRVDSMNVLNRVTFVSWNTTVNSAEFGLPTAANAMRTLQPSLRVRF